MDIYIFSSNRQLMFYVSISGQMRLVRFGDRNMNGTSVFQTSNKETAEAIRKHSLFKRGVVKESFIEDKSVGKTNGRSNVKTSQGSEVNAGRATAEVNTAEGIAADGTSTEVNTGEGGIQEEVIEAKNYTQAKSMLAKRLEISYNDIKNPDQLLQLAKKSGITIRY